MLNPIDYFLEDILILPTFHQITVINLIISKQNKIKIQESGTFNRKIYVRENISIKLKKN